MPASTSYIVTFISTKDIGVLGTAPWCISMGNPSGIRVVNFIVMMGMCEGRKITTNMGVLLQECHRAIKFATIALLRRKSDLPGLDFEEVRIFVVIIVNARLVVTILV